MTFTWSEAAQRQADFCRRKHLAMEYWPQILPQAERVAADLDTQRITIRIVQEACRQLQCEHDSQQAQREGAGR